LGRPFTYLVDLLLSRRLGEPVRSWLLFRVGADPDEIPNLLADERPSGYVASWPNAATFDLLSIEAATGERPARGHPEVSGSIPGAPITKYLEEAGICSADRDRPN
jgi:hypothetical protein